MQIVHYTTETCREMFTFMLVCIMRAFSIRPPFLLSVGKRCYTLDQSLQGRGKCPPLFPKAYDILVSFMQSVTGKEEKPIMIFEIKRSVNGNLSRVGIGGLSQTLLESCYCGLRYKTRQITACLTDVATWHFIKCDCPLDEPQMVVVKAATTVTTCQDYKTLIHTMAGMLLNGIEELDN